MGELLLSHLLQQVNLQLILFLLIKCLEALYDCIYEDQLYLILNELTLYPFPFKFLMFLPTRRDLDINTLSDLVHA